MSYHNNVLVITECNISENLGQTTKCLPQLLVWYQEVTIIEALLVIGWSIT